MAGDPAANEDRRRRLGEVRAEIERELAQGVTLSPSDWTGRYPDLQPELGEMLRALIGAVPTRGSDAAGDTIDLPTGREPGPSPETVDLSPSELAGPSPETVAASSRPGVAGGLTTVQTPNDAPTTLHGADPGQTQEADAHAETEPAPREAGGLPAGRKVRYIGDYETISVLGQGGMGIVYKARQMSLNRLVALKMIKNAEFANSEQVRRFQNEAEAVATLDHPGIVPIYEVGTYEDQRYFSMKLVEGHGLDKKLKDLAKEPRTAARIVSETADAVHHAHQRGILHRDLKPANVLLDGLEHPHVTDFGLAKKIDEDAGLTVSGAIMGTPSYMSPEQAAGRMSLVTIASDVYGLGAILYATITGKAPFAADSVLDTLEQVRRNPPQPPTRLNSEVPRDLEVICLKCLEKDPRHRYASASALSDDLNRWLRGEPIAARPVGPAVRLAMWAKRKPALAALSAALIVALIAGVIGVTWQWREAVWQRNQAQIARDEALAQERAAREAEKAAQIARDEAVASEKRAVAAKALADENAQVAGIQATLALNTIQDLISQVRDKLQAPGLYDLKTALLESALKRVNGVADVYQKSTSKEATAAAALMELGTIYRQLGQTERAFQAYQKCLEITKERVKIKKYSDPSRSNLANNYFQLALVSEELRRDMKAALDYNLEGLKLYEDIYNKPMLEDHPMDRKAVRQGLSEAYTRVGTTHYRLGELPPALEYYRKAHNLRRELIAEVPDNPVYKQELSYSLIALAELSFRLGDRARGEDYYLQALYLRGAMAKLLPNDLKVQKELGDVFYMLGEFRLRGGELAAARTYLEKSRTVRQALVDREPRNAILRRDLGLAFYRLGGLAEAEKNPEQAGKDFRASLGICEELAKQSAENDRRQTELLLSLAHAGDPTRARELADRIAAGPNVDRELRVDLARAYAQIAHSTPPAETEKVQTGLVKAVEAVRAAVRDGYRDKVFLETEPDLEPLRGREDFRRIVADLRPS